VFNESDPIAFLKELRPDIHVNGSEYGDNCIESETVTRAGGQIYIVDRIPGFSTSHLIDAAQSSGSVAS
jgi:bifunctional ADP-heptose synthase (sugar kinase/adenylyltransferase)